MAPSIPICPKWVRGEAIEYWPEIAEILLGLGLIAPPYSAALGVLVNALARYVRFSGEAVDAPTILAGRVNPVFALEGQAADRVVKLLCQFGLTPSAISSVKSVKEDAPQSALQQIKLA